MVILLFFRTEYLGYAGLIPRSRAPRWTGTVPGNSHSPSSNVFTAQKAHGHTLVPQQMLAPCESVFCALPILLHPQVTLSYLPRLCVGRRPASPTLPDPPPPVQGTLPSTGSWMSRGNTMALSDTDGPFPPYSSFQELKKKKKRCFLLISTENHVKLYKESMIPHQQTHAVIYTTVGCDMGTKEKKSH